VTRLRRRSRPCVRGAGGSDTGAVLSWTPRRTARRAVTYDIFKSAAPGAENFTAPLMTISATSAQITVPYGQHAYFVVRSKDAAGNEDTNSIEKDYLPVDTLPPTFAALRQWPEEDRIPPPRLAGMQPRIYREGRCHITFTNPPRRAPRIRGSVHDKRRDNERADSRSLRTTCIFRRPRQGSCRK